MSFSFFLVIFKLSTFFNQKCLSALNAKQRATFSVTQGLQNESEPKMGCKTKSASDYSKENDDVVMETIKGKPELVCKHLDNYNAEESLMSF